MPKVKSEFVRRLDDIQAAVHSFLRPLGFRKKGRAHNRLTKGGLTHVLSFQMGEYPIGEHYVIPGLRESFYGKLAVNLGVFLPCVDRVENAGTTPAFLHDYHCTIRNRLGCLAFGEDRWFEMTEDAAALAKTVVDLIDRFGLPFLEQFDSYVDVLRYYREHGDLPFQNPGRASLDAALIAHETGDEILCQSLLQRARSSNHEGFQKYVVKIAERIGHNIG